VHAADKHFVQQTVSCVGVMAARVEHTTCWIVALFVGILLRHTAGAGETLDSLTQILAAAADKLVLVLSVLTLMTELANICVVTCQ